MTDTTSLPSLESTAPSMHRTGGMKKRLMTDAPMRTFHALFGLSFTLAYLTADSEHWRLLHVTCGYSFAVLLIGRILYGFVGPRPAQWLSLFQKLRHTVPWWLSRRSWMNVNFRNQGLTLAMAWTVTLMLCLVLPLTLSGHVQFNEWGGELLREIMEELHELMGNTLLLLVLVHLSVVVLISIQKKQNHAKLMGSGRLLGVGPDLVQHNRYWLAGLMLVAWIGLVIWIWKILI